MDGWLAGTDRPVFVAARVNNLIMFIQMIRNCCCGCVCVVALHRHSGNMAKSVYCCPPLYSRPYIRVQTYVPGEWVILSFHKRQKERQTGGRTDGPVIAIYPCNEPIEQRGTEVMLMYESGTQACRYAWSRIYGRNKVKIRRSFFLGLNKCICCCSVVPN